MCQVMQLLFKSQIASVYIYIYIPYIYINYCASIFNKPFLELNSSGFSHSIPKAVINLYE